MEQITKMSQWKKSSNGACSFVLMNLSLA